MAKKRFASKINIKKGDKVVVVAGTYKGVEGSVLEVIPATYRAVVDGVNVMKKHELPTKNADLIRRAQSLAKQAGGN